MKIVGTAAVFGLLMASITALFCWRYPGPSSSPKKEPSAVTVIGTRGSVPEQNPSVNDLRQNDDIGPNHSFCIDSAIKRTLREPDAYKFISATLWTQDFARYGPKAWICQAEYHSKNAIGGYGDMVYQRKLKSFSMRMVAGY